MVKQTQLHRALLRFVVGSAEGITRRVRVALSDTK